MIDISIKVHPEDISKVYSFMAKYHEQGPSVFDLKSFETFERAPSEFSCSSHTSSKRKLNINKTEKTDLYELILNKCTCCKCYNLLSRPDRTPWRLLDEKQDGKFRTYINAIHGRAVINSECELATRFYQPISGYVYATPVEAQKQRYNTIIKSAADDERSLKRADAEVAKLQSQITESDTNTKINYVNARNKNSTSIMDQISRCQKWIESDEKKLEKLTSQLSSHGISEADALIDTLPPLGKRDEIAKILALPAYTSMEEYEKDAKLSRVAPETFDGLYSSGLLRHLTGKPMIAIWRIIDSMDKINKNIEKSEATIKRLQDGENAPVTQYKNNNINNRRSAALKTGAEITISRMCK